MLLPLCVKMDVGMMYYKAGNTLIWADLPVKNVAKNTRHLNDLIRYGGGWSESCKTGARTHIWQEGTCQ